MCSDFKQKGNLCYSDKEFQNTFGNIIGEVQRYFGNNLYAALKN